MQFQTTTTVYKSTASVKTEARHLPDSRILISTLLKTDADPLPYFSLAITLFRDGVGEDLRLIEDITRDLATAHTLFQRITEGTVTPCTLTDVLEDLLE